MKKISKTVIFFGNERLATGVSTTAPTLRALVGAGYHVAAVVSSFVVGESRRARTLEIEAVAAEYDIPLLLPNRVADIADQLNAYQPDVGVLVAYGQIVPQSILDIFPAGIINIHPSLLPLHRGSTPIESSILAGEVQTGVSIMQLIKAMDAGPVFGQSMMTLTGKESKQRLADELLELGGATLISLLPGILRGDVIAKPQDSDYATYDSLISKQDGLIDWQKPAIQIEREIRAFKGWPGSRTTLADKEVTITEAHVTDASGQPGQTIATKTDLSVTCSNGSITIDSLKPSGKAEMSVQAFLSGYGRLLN